ncbi:MAG: hypothetical protein JXR91_15395 [Deltaproteobacteria bacterium]|nr:hypothetical protein [Deltaproteobacteria bacterium]
MIYCPHCKKPSAGTSTNCPHCGKPFKNVSSAAPLATGLGHPQKSKPANSTQAYNASNQFGADIEFNDDTGESDNLQLETVDTSRQSDSFSNTTAPSHEKPLDTDYSSPPPSDSSKSTAVTTGALALSAKKIAGFGEPEKGLIGTLKYGYTVYKRLDSLREELAAVSKEKEEAWEDLDVSKATLGRAAYSYNVDDATVARLIKKALVLDKKLDEIKRETDSINEKFNEQIEKINVAVSGVKEEMKPYKIKEIKLQTAFDLANTNLKRASAMVKRREIELRNIKELIEKRQKDYSDLEKPKEERARLLKDIADLDNKHIPILSSLKDEQKELDSLKTPFEEAKTALGENRDILASKNEIIHNFNNQKAALQKELEITVDAITQKAKGESVEIQKAWSAVGERVFVNKLFTSQSVKAVAIEVNDKSQKFIAAQTKEQQYQLAVDSYDKEQYELAQKYAKLGAAAIAVIIILIVVLAVI